MSNYIEKLKTYGKDGFGDRRSVYEILSLNPNIENDYEILKREYRAVDIDKVIIDGETFTNYGSFQFIWEKTYAVSPERGIGGVIDDLNNHITFIVPHLIMDFSIMSIDDYRCIMRKDLERNEFVVECYDPIYNKKIKVKMYFATQQMAKLNTIARRRFNGEEWEDWIDLVGVNEYSVELIGTNADLDLVSVIYHKNPPSDTGVADETSGEGDVYKGEQVIIGANTTFQQETFNGRYKFKNWSLYSTITEENKDKGIYLNDYAYTINTDLVLYAQWESMEKHTLNFNYGIADPSINESENTYETSRKVSYKKSIGTLPIVEIPSVEIDNVKYYPYYDGAWYKIPILTLNANKFKVDNNELYWANKDSTIYYLFKTHTYTLEKYLDGKLYSTEDIEYNTRLSLPQLVKEGYTFDGWYYNADFSGEKAKGNMPPKKISLYARFNKVEEK